MADMGIVGRCRTKLIEAASTRRLIEYGELAAFLGIANQAVGKYLNPIYEEEIARGHPDLTVVVVYSGTGMGRYNSRGGSARSFKVDPENAEHVRGYKEELEGVYRHWSRK